MFLALGLSALIAFEMLLISGGVLGAIPLSGVVSPFLSFGNTAMLANFLIFGFVIAISNHGKESVVIDEPFRKPVVRLEWVFEPPRRRFWVSPRIIRWRTIRISWRAMRRSLKTMGSGGRSGTPG